MTITITAAANLSSPVSDALEWSACSDVGGIDPTTGDHYQFRSQQGSTPIQLYTSIDAGVTWNATATDATTPYTGGLHGLMCIDQDVTNGAVHMVLYNASGITSAMGYGRVTFTTSGGHITGYTWARTPVNLTNHSTSNFDPRGQIKVFTISGVECIVYMISRGSNSGTNLRYYAGLSTSLTPSSSASFTGIDTSGSDTVMVNITDASATRSCHTFCCVLAQNKTTEDIVLFCGHVFSGDTLNTPNGSISDLWYKLLVRSGGGWTAPTSTTTGTAVVSQNGTSAPSMCAVRSHANGAYVMYNDPANGIKYAYITSTPSQTTISGSPLSTANRGGWGTFVVDTSGNILSVYKTEGVSGVTPVCGEASWDGSSWTNTNDTATQNVLNIYGTCNGVTAITAALIEGDSIAQTVPSPNVVKVATLSNATSTNYTLTASSGTYAVTGQSAILTKTKLLTASSGSYAYTGKAAILTKSKLLTASVGTYTYSGQSVTITKSKLLTASVGSYTYTGQSASLLKTKLLTASAGSYAINGQDATITYTPNAGAYVLTALSGSYSISGQSATLLKSYELTAQSGTYSYTGQDAVVTYATVPSGSGSNPGGGGGGGSNPGLGLPGTGSKYYPDLDIKKKSIPDSPIEPEPVIIAKTVTVKAVKVKPVNTKPLINALSDEDEETIIVRAIEADHKVIKTILSRLST